MSCARAEELLSDHLEGTLAPPLSLEVRDHVATCGRCAELLAAVGEVVAALADSPDVEPPVDLAARAAGLALLHGRPAPRNWQWVPLPVAALLAVSLTLGGTLALAPQPARQAQRIVRDGLRAGSDLRRRGEHLVEDLRVLRVVVATALEGRVERVNDRLEDYRRWLDRQRHAEPDDGEARFVNPDRLRSVASDAGRDRPHGPGRGTPHRPEESA